MAAGGEGVHEPAEGVFDLLSDFFSLEEAGPVN